MGCKNPLNFTYLTMKFHNRHHTNIHESAVFLDFTLFHSTSICNCSSSKAILEFLMNGDFLLNEKKKRSVLDKRQTIFNFPKVKGK